MLNCILLLHAMYCMCVCHMQKGYLLLFSLTHSLTYLLSYLLSYLLIYLFAYLVTYLFTYLLTYLLTYLFTYLLTYLRTYIHTYLLTKYRAQELINSQWRTRIHSQWIKLEPVVSVLKAMFPLSYDFSNYM